MLRTVILLDNELDTAQELNKILSRSGHAWDLCHLTEVEAARQMFSDRTVDLIIARSSVPHAASDSFWEGIVVNSPHTVRIGIASRFQEKNAAESFKFTHQYLAEAVGVDRIIEIVDYITYLQNLLANIRLESELGGLLSLQALPDAYIAIIKELQSSEPSLKRISSLIQQDMAMTARVLQLVNSAFFSLPNRVTKIEQAVSLLGISTIKNMLMSMQLFSVFEGGPVPKRHAEKVWEHSVKVAGLAREIAAREQLSKEGLETIMLSGMLHDLGQLILFKLPEYREALVKQRREGYENELAAEMELYSCSHAETGAYLLGIWGLDREVVDVVMHHHLPGRSTRHEGFNELTAVHVADYVINMRTRSDSSQIPQIDMEYLEEMGLADKLEQWLSIGA